MRKSGFILKISAFVMCAMFCILSFPTPARAASNVCTGIFGYTKTVKFRVDTGKRWILSDYIKFTQTKGTANYESTVGFSAKQKTYTEYGNYSITAKPIYGGGKTVTATWKDGTYTLKLASNTMYDVTVSLNEQYKSLYPGHFPYFFKNWKTPPTWSISVTKGIISCY